MQHSIYWTPTELIAFKFFFQTLMSFLMLMLMLLRFKMYKFLLLVLCLKLHSIQWLYTNTNVWSDVILSANSNVCEERDGEGGEEWAISPSKSKTKLCLCTNPHLSVRRKILAGFLYFTPAGWHWHIKPKTQLLVLTERLDNCMKAFSILYVWFVFIHLLAHEEPICFHSSNAYVMYVKV